jgi:hypothetical protein
MRWKRWCILEKQTFDGHRVIVDRINAVVGDQVFQARDTVHNVGRFLKQVREVK